jgi:hypothetical protein
VHQTLKYLSRWRRMCVCVWCTILVLGMISLIVHSLLSLNKIDFSLKRTWYGCNWCIWLFLSFLGWLEPPFCVIMMDAFAMFVWYLLLLILQMGSI